MKNFLTVKQAADFLNVSANVLRKWNHSGALRFYHIGPPNVDIMGRDRRIVRVKRADLLKLID